MKHTVKKILAFIIVLSAALGLASCGKANTYRKFANNSSNLSKAHVLEEVSYKELYKLVDKTGTDEYLYVFIGNPTASAATDAVGIYNEQAIQYGIEKLYWLDSNLDDDRLALIKERLSLTELKSNKAYLLSFNNGSIFFDSANELCNKEDDKSLSRQQMAYRCFNNLTSVIEK